MRPIDWIVGKDTGVSSKTIWAVMMGAKVIDTPWGTTPCDPSDFGRCFKLLFKFPEWRERLQEVADKIPKWQPFVDKWDEMEMLYIRDLPKGKSKDLYKLMSGLE